MEIQITDDENFLYFSYGNITQKIEKFILFETSQKEFSDEEIKNQILFLSRTKTINELKELTEI